MSKGRVFYPHGKVEYIISNNINYQYILEPQRFMTLFSVYPSILVDLFVFLV